MVALLDLGIPLSVMARVALQRPQCEVAVCFSLSPWGFRRVTFDKLVWDPVGSSSRSPLIMRLLLGQAAAPSPSWLLRTVSLLPPHYWELSSIIICARLLLGSL